MVFSIAAFPDIHAFFTNIRAMRKQLADIDVVLLVGDMTNGQISSLHQLLDYITPYNRNILSVCGNHDNQEIENYLEEHGMSIHAKHRIINDIAFLGCGGALPFVGNYVFGEDEFASILDRTNKELSPEIPKILVSHQPPYGTKLDRTYSGRHVGSHSVRKFIKKEQPLICFTGHIHEAVGIDSIGNTKLINSGMIEGTNRFAYVEIEKGIVTKLEMKKANPHG